MAEQMEINKPHLLNVILEQRLIANAVIDTVNVLNAVCFTVDAPRRCDKMYLMQSSIGLQLKLINSHLLCEQALQLL